MGRSPNLGDSVEVPRQGAAGVPAPTISVRARLSAAGDMAVV